MPAAQAEPRPAESLCHAAPRRTTTIEDAARMLGIGRSLANDLARQGRLPGIIKLGTRFVVALAAIERVLAGDDTQLANQQPLVGSRDARTTE